jgi:hypothetical protein
MFNPSSGDPGDISGSRYLSQSIINGFLDLSATNAAA